MENNGIRGAGGLFGGGGDQQQPTQRAPVESPDSLRSKQYARVIDLICEGEVSGLVGGLKGIYLDGTPIENDGSPQTYNFAGVVAAVTNGVQDQPALPGMNSVESEVIVNVQVTNAASVTRQITNSSIDRVRVTLGFPQLTTQDTTTGDLSGASVSISIQRQSNGGGYTTIVNDTISGKTTTRYQRQYEIDLAGDAPWDIRIIRNTSDSASATLQNSSWWDSYTLLIDTKLSYPNSAVVGIEIDSQQFKSVPVRGYHMKGLLINIPSNYNPVTRVYTGVWDGTFTVAYSNNPAWCLYDILTNDRYGLGNYLSEADIDKWSFYEIGVYCDELVPDGFGGSPITYEPRYTCNLYLQSRDEALRVVNAMASIFFGLTYWSAGAVFASADMPADATALFSEANVIDGVFSYSGTSRAARHTVALVSWNDPDNGYRQAVEYVEDRAGVERYGVNATEILALGCTSRGQAHRYGERLLYTERLSTEVVTFKVGLDALFCAPGDVIKIQDQARAGQRWAGRVLSATGAGSPTTFGTVVIDAPVTLQQGLTYTLSAQLPDGSMETRNVSTAIGSPDTTTSTLTVSTAFSSDPQRMAIWILESAAVSASLWRVMSVTETALTQFEITALQYDENKYSDIEQGTYLGEVLTSTLTDVPSPVSQLTVTETLIELSAGSVTNRTVVSWIGVTGRYIVNYRKDNGNWVALSETSSSTIDIDGLTPGNYTFSVRQLSVNGSVSPATEATSTLVGKTAAPADVTGFSVQQNGSNLNFRWQQVTDIDLQGYEIRYNDEGITDWDSGQVVTSVTRGTGITNGFVPPGTWVLLIKAVDTTGNYSDNAATFNITVENFNEIVIESAQAVEWLGVLNHFVKHWTGKLIPDSQSLASALGWELFDSAVYDPYPLCYYAAPVYDQEFNDTLRIYANIISTQMPGETTYEDPYLQIRTAVTGGTLGSYQNWDIGVLNMRYLQAQLVVDTSSGIPVITDFIPTLDRELYSQSGTSVAVAAGGTVITFDPPFHATPNIQVTAHAEVSPTEARYATYSSASETGFTVQVFTASGTAVDGTVNWVANGG